MAELPREKRQEIDARLQELRPLVDEFTRLEKAAAALAGVGGSGSSHCNAHPPVERRDAPPARPPARERNRAKQALELVRARPGITITEIADAMGIKANYLYRVMPTLQKEGGEEARQRAGTRRNRRGPGESACERSLLAWLTSLPPMPRTPPSCERAASVSWRTVSSAASPG